MLIYEFMQLLTYTKVHGVRYLLTYYLKITFFHMGDTVQTYTHLLLGVAGGIALFPDSRVEQIAFTVGSVLADTEAARIMIIDVLKKRAPFAQQSEFSKGIVEWWHSLLLWVAITVTALVVPSNGLLPFALGGIIHVVIDIFTHSGEGKYESDPTFLYPLRWRLNLCIWEYRYDHGVLMPKPFEALVCSLMIGSIFARLF